MKLTPLIILSLVPFLLHAETQLDKQLAEAKQVISTADDVLQEIQANEKTAIPSDVLSEAEAVLIVKLNSAMVGVGGYGGTGIAMVNNIDNWSPPAIYTVGGGSLGIEIGATETNLVALFMNKKAMRTLYDSSIRWGVGLSVKAGPVGGTLGASGWKDADVLVYRVKKGFALGASFSGGTLDYSQDLNSALYKEPDVTIQDILGMRVPMPAEALDVTDELRKLSYQDSTSASTKSATPAAKSSK